MDGAKPVDEHDATAAPNSQQMAGSDVDPSDKGGSVGRHAEEAVAVVEQMLAALAAGESLEECKDRCMWMIRSQCLGSVHSECIRMSLRHAYTRGLNRLRQSPNARRGA